MTTGDAAYEWDPAKAASNLASHGVSFDDVAAFEFTTALVEEDVRHRYGERRLIALGAIRKRVHVLVYTERGAHIRVISLRKANDREVKRYVRSIEQKGIAG